MYSSAQKDVMKPMVRQKFVSQSLRCSLTLSFCMVGVGSLKDTVLVQAQVQLHQWFETMLSSLGLQWTVNPKTPLTSDLLLMIETYNLYHIRRVCEYIVSSRLKNMHVGFVVCGPLLMRSRTKRRGTQLCPSWSRRSKRTYPKSRAVLMLPS